MTTTIDSLRQHQLIILRRLRGGPLTEFELVSEVVASTGFTVEQAMDRMAEWLDELRQEGLLWAGALTNANGQTMWAAALTRRGQELVA
ncbi:MAG TPA: hypothetical protein PKK06_14905 [Phycisphaerae bacterium]|nr:hypothetical protein [Phycisphaerae bacterium]HNU46572.1 hypothetical protein [Phycisphaerae bacterium]